MRLNAAAQTVRDGFGAMAEGLRAGFGAVRRFGETLDSTAVDRLAVRGAAAETPLTIAPEELRRAAPELTEWFNRHTNAVGGPPGGLLPPTVANAQTREEVAAAARLIGYPLCECGHPETDHHGFPDARGYCTRCGSFECGFFQAQAPTASAGEGDDG